MKPFNLEEAKAGAPVCTREGNPARIICFDVKDINFPIVALMGSPTLDSEHVVTYRLNGQYVGGYDSKYDLFMAEEEYEEEHYDISNFKPFDKVLVRDNNDEQWRASFFSHYEPDENMPFQVPFITGGHAYFQCIPYNEETAHLVGTTGMPPKKYINW